jgi:hypothetical protein
MGPVVQADSEGGSPAQSLQKKKLIIKMQGLLKLDSPTLQPSEPPAPTMLDSWDRHPLGHPSHHPVCGLPQFSSWFQNGNQGTESRAGRALVGGYLQCRTPTSGSEVQSPGILGSAWKYWFTRSPFTASSGSVLREGSLESCPDKSCDSTCHGLSSLCMCVFNVYFLNKL